MRKLLIILIIVIPVIGSAQSLEDYSFPIKEGKIEIDSTIAAQGTKESIFKGVQEFFAVRYFDKTVTVKAKSDNYTSLKILDRPILYQDAETGKIIGNGWIPLNWSDHKYTFVIFKIEAWAADNKLSYRLSEFQAVDILDGPRSKRAAIGGILFSASSGASSPTISKMYPFEQYITKVRFPSKWLVKKDGYAKTFKGDLSAFQKELISTVFK